ncbi:MAG: bifunctional folylpolyglutamate synthase/dihydrofolate synthase, partial [Deltaproteobacteria bacterium]|nr:bifunctional folylpolyglutamate synthase/dihydrofolate synthase [Deltaproteobacteria bacterium]
MSIRSYEHALTYLLALEKKGIFLSVEATQQALACLGNPQKNFPSVLVAGTNGKGSTVAMLSSILRQAGYRV